MMTGQHQRMQLDLASKDKFQDIIFIALFLFEIGKRAKNEKESSEAWCEVYRSGTPPMDEQSDSLRDPLRLQ